MKKLTLFTFIILLSFAARSQIVISLLLGDKLNSPDLEFGLEGGLNFTNVSGFETSDYLRNFNLGFYFDYRVKNQWFLYTGVQVKSTLGMDKLTDNDLQFLQADTYEANGDYKQRISAFMVPILANYKFKNHFYVEAGPQLGLRWKSWVSFTSDENDKDIKIKQYDGYLMHRLNAGFAGGFGYKLQKGTGMTIGFRYYQGVTDVYKDRSGTKNNSIHLKMNIPIGAGDSKAKKSE